MHIHICYLAQDTPKNYARASQTTEQCHPWRSSIAPRSNVRTARAGTHQTPLASCCAGLDNSRVQLC